MIQPEFDKYGYPTGDTLVAIHKWDFKGESHRELMEFVEEAWRDYGPFDSEQSEDTILYSIATGGWSGNESLVGALMDNTIFWALCWMSSSRGGQYEFEVKKRPVK